MIFKNKIFIPICSLVICLILLIFVYDLIKFSKVKNDIVISNKYKLEFLVDEKNVNNKTVEKNSSLLSELSKDILNYFHESYINELNENNEKGSRHYIF